MENGSSNMSAVYFRTYRFDNYTIHAIKALIDGGVFLQSPARHEERKGFDIYWFGEDTKLTVLDAPQHYRVILDSTGRFIGFENQDTIGVLLSIGSVSKSKIKTLSKLCEDHYGNPESDILKAALGVDLE